jgi:hypothetical protein
MNGRPEAAEFLGVGREETASYVGVAPPIGVIENGF